MNLHALNDQELLNRTEHLAARERELLAEVLRHLREIARRRLFASLGYKSLFDYCVRRLRYSEDQAGRRIAAMRLLEELPEIENKIAEGALTLSHLGLAQAHFRTEANSQHPVSRSEKLEMLAELHGKSQREAQKIIIEKSSAPSELKPDRVRVVSCEQVEIKFLAGAELLENLERVRGLLAHRQSHMTMAELFSAMSELALDTLDPARHEERRKSRSRKTAQSAKSEPASTVRPTEATVLVKSAAAAEVVVTSASVGAADKASERADVKPARASAPAHASASATSRDAKGQAGTMNRAAASKQVGCGAMKRAIPAATRRQIWRECGSRCANCGSRRALEIEHRQPFACGGSHEPENLTLLCRSCNQRAAIERLGVEKMHRYLHPRRLSTADREKVARSSQEPQPHSSTKRLVAAAFSGTYQPPENNDTSNNSTLRWTIGSQTPRMTALRPGPVQ